MPQDWSRRTAEAELKLSGFEHSQLLRGILWGIQPTHLDDPLGPEAYILFEPIGAAGGKLGPAAGKPTTGGGGSAPTDIRLSNASVDEGVAAGTVIGTLSAVDPDKRDKFTFSIVSDGDSKFAISGTSLVLRSGATLDYETKTSHAVTIRVTDSTGKTYDEAFTIAVRDVFEGGPVAPTDILLSKSSVKEGATSGTVVGTLSAVDPNVGDSFTWTLLDNAGGRFALNGSSLVVANGALLDYETATSHQVLVKVTDSAGLAYQEAMTIQVLDSTGLADQPNYIQAMLPQVGGEAYYFWPDKDLSTPKTTITFTLLTAFPSYYNPSAMPYTNYTTDVTPFVQLTAEQRTVIYQMLDELETLVDVEFVEVTSASAANITFGMYLQDSGIGAFAYYPSASGATGTTAGDVWLNSRYDSQPTTSTVGGADWSRSTIAHELGHAMGLKHPGNYDAGGGGTPPPYLDPAVDNGRYTTMSYNDFPSSSHDPLDYMLYDIAALQYLYGANMGHATGNDLYLFSTSANTIDTIWDAGGADTFSAAGATAAVTLDLREGFFSTVGIVQNIGIAYGVTIEAAQGGAGADRLVGNAADNTLAGGAGADTMAFGAGWGDDLVLDFQDGVDRIQFVGTGLAFANLVFLDFGDYAEVRVAAGDTIRLLAITTANLSSADFLFA